MDFDNKVLSLREFVSSSADNQPHFEQVQAEHILVEKHPLRQQTHTVCHAFLLLLPYSLKFKALNDLSKCYVPS